VALLTEQCAHPGTLIEPATKALAIFSECRGYRVYLEWRWSTAPALYVCMLNPSTADAFKLDPTITGLVKRAKAWGYGAVVVVNLFALRATNPADMLAHAAPVGPDNDAVLAATMAQAFNEGSPLLVGWGNHGSHMGRDKVVVEMAQRQGFQLMALAVNDNGQPRHPLYVGHEVRPKLWTVSPSRPATCDGSANASR
jgi:hypothetical protein